MDFLDIDKEYMIKLLLEDNKINVVREAIMNDDYSSMIAEERLNYCTDEELRKITETEESIISTLIQYKASDKLIDLLVEDFINSDKVIKFVIAQYMNKIKPKHLNKLIEHAKYKELVLDNLEKASKEAVFFLHEKKLIKNPTQKQLSAIYAYEFADVDIKTLNLNAISSMAYEKKLTREELDYTINRIFETKIDLFMKGHIDFILHTQIVPDEYLKVMIMEWEYTQDELWFKRLLMHQKLDSVIDYILENYTLNETSVCCIMKNNKTSPKKLIKLYKKYSDLIVKAGSKTLPVLDCHLHMC